MNYRNLVSDASRYSGLLDGINPNDLLNCPRFIMPGLPFDDPPGGERLLTFAPGDRVPFTLYCVECLGEEFKAVATYWMIIKNRNWTVLCYVSEIKSWHRIGSTNDGSCPVFTAAMDGRMLTYSEEESQNAWKSLGPNVTQFLWMCQNPSNHVVRVVDQNENPAKCKWRISREHFLILDRKATLQKLDSARGNIIRQEMMRAAGRRIGHPRTFQHPKWGDKVGTTIWIKDTWCGPPEWKWVDGKTYTWIDPKLLKS